MGKDDVLSFSDCAALCQLATSVQVMNRSGEGDFIGLQGGIYKGQALLNPRSERQKKIERETEVEVDASVPARKKKYARTSFPPCVFWVFLSSSNTP
jgi:hypothetical protein